MSNVAAIIAALNKRGATTVRDNRYFSPIYHHKGGKSKVHPYRK